tara:strand:+ start:3637 stop:4887 length:1251 start_codon:yes stop_codon:yes gene_type:complete
MKNYLENNSGKISFLLLSLSLFIGFFFNEDSSGSGGHIADFYDTWPYVEALTKNFFVLPQLWTDNTPLNYMILSWFNYFFNDKYIVRIIYCFISILLPILFYFSLKSFYRDSDNNKLLLLASLMFLFPSFRSGAIWANNSVMANIFFVTFIIFFNNWLREAKFDKININIICQLFFLALAVYTRQYYALIYLFAMYMYFKKLSIKNFLTVSFIVFIFTLPGFWLITNEPRVLVSVFSPKIYNTILITPSIMSFYLIPVFLIVSLKSLDKINFQKKISIPSIIFFTALIILMTITFDYNYKVGGGFFIKLSYIAFGNVFFASLTSVVGLILLYYLAREHNDNIVLVILLIFGFPAYYIFQKYYEPMFFLMLFLMFKSEIPKLFIKNKRNIYYMAIYLGIYLTLAISNNIFKITKAIV